MAVGFSKNQLIQLYSIALEEARHRDRLYTQTLVAGIIVFGILLTALSFTSKIEQTLTLKGSLVLAGFLIVLGCLLLMWFYWSICQHAREGRNRRDIARSIEDILAGKTQKDAIKLDNLLVMRKTKERRLLRDKDVWSPLVDPVARLSYPLILLAVWIVVCLFSTGYMG